MTLHQLELFYFVASHHGITRAAQHMPYGIQQPAISEQIARLEAWLQRPLFERRPFRLTAVGWLLFEFVRPFFSALPELTASLAPGHVHWRIAAPDDLMEDRWLRALSTLLRRRPDHHLSLKTGSSARALAWLQSGEVDLALTSHGRAAKGLGRRELGRRSLVLLVRPDSRHRSAAQLWQRANALPPLIVPHADEGATLAFRRSLRQSGIAWPAALTTDMPAALVRSVADGDWVALALAPTHPRPSGLRVLPLAGFERVPIHLNWRAADTARLQPLLRVFRPATR